MPKQLKSLKALKTFSKLAFDMHLTQGRPVLCWQHLELHSLLCSAALALLLNYFPGINSCMGAKENALPCHFTSKANCA